MYGSKSKQGGVKQSQALSKPQNTRNDASHSRNSSKQYNCIKDIINNKEKLQLVIDQTFDSADTNGSGLLDKKEFDICISIIAYWLGLPTPSQQKIWQLFKQFDKNRSGFLNKGEFAHIVILVLQEVEARQDQMEEEIKTQKAKAELARILLEKERIKRVAGYSYMKLLKEKKVQLKEQGEKINDNLGIDYYQFNQIFYVLASFLQVDDPTQEQIDQLFDDIDVDKDANIQYNEFMAFMEDILNRLLGQKGKSRFTWGDVIKTQSENIYETIYSNKTQIRNCVQRAFIAGDLDNSKSLEGNELPLVFSILAQQLNMAVPSENKINEAISRFNGQPLSRSNFEECVDVLFHILIEDENKRLEFEMKNSQKITWNDLFTNELKLKRFTQKMFRQFTKGQSDFLEFNQLDIFVGFICNKLKLQQPTQKEIKHLKLTFDVSKDGKFSVEEFQQILFEFLKAAQVEKQLKEEEKRKEESDARRRQKIQSILEDKDKLDKIVENLFQELNIDNDGGLDGYEFSYALEYLAKFYKLTAPNPQESDDIFRNYDKDGNQNIDQDEFKEIIIDIFKSKLDNEVFSWKMKKQVSLQEILQSEQLKKGLIIIFKAADKDKSGTIEEEELDDVLKQTAKYFEIPKPTDEEIDWALSKIDQKDETKLTRDEYEQFVILLLQERVNQSENRTREGDKIQDRYEPFVKDLFKQVNKDVILYQDVEAFAEEINATNRQMKDIVDKLEKVHKKKVWEKFDDYEDKVYKKILKGGKKNMKNWVKSFENQDLIKKPLNIDLEEIITLPQGKELEEWQITYLKNQLPTLEKLLDQVANKINKTKFMVNTTVERDRNNLAKQVKQKMKEIKEYKDKLEDPEFYLKIIELIPELKQMEELDQLPVQALQELCKRVIGFAKETMANVFQIQNKQSQINKFIPGQTIGIEVYTESERKQYLQIQSTNFSITRIKRYGIEITNEDLASLQENQLVSEKIFAFFIKYYQEKIQSAAQISNKNFFIFDFPFFQNMMPVGAQMHPSFINYQGVKHLTANHSGDNNTIFQRFDKILCFINLSTTQFLLLEIQNTIQKEINIYDPQYNDFTDLYEKIVSVIKKYMELELKDKSMQEAGDIVFEVKKYQGKAGSCVTNYPNYINNGLHCLKLFQQILQGADIAPGTTRGEDINQLRYELFVTLLRIETHQQEIGDSLLPFEILI